MPPHVQPMEVEVPVTEAQDAPRGRPHLKVTMGLMALAGVVFVVPRATRGEGDIISVTPSAVGRDPSELLMEPEDDDDSPTRKPFGAMKDARGCLPSAGFGYCPHHGKCIRHWEESCPGGTEACQALCALEPLNGHELPRCTGLHQTWKRGLGPFSYPGERADHQHEGCEAYVKDEIDGDTRFGNCDSDADADDNIAQDVCPQCKKCSVVKETSCKCESGKAVDFMPPAESV
jgi:hypothetical protein